MLFFVLAGNNQSMKKMILLLVFLIVSLSVVGVLFLNTSTEKSNSDYLRIHIRANSNSDIDQKVKYAIKDAYINFLTPKIALCESKEDVTDLIISETKTLEALANSVLKENGFDYTSKVKINSEMFPTRTYEGYTLESGIYDAVIVELGEAQGNNWWCVIYPPLCFTNYSSSNSTSVVYKSKIWEIIKQFFS